MRLLLTLFLLFNSFYLFSESRDTTVLITEIKTPLNLNKYTYIHSTSDTTSSSDFITQKEYEYSSDGLKGINHHTIYWERFSFTNPTNKTVDYYIYFPYSVINKIIVYKEYNGKIEPVTSLGMMYGQKNKHIKTIGHPILVKLQPGHTNIYIYIKHFSLALRTNPILLTKDQLVEANSKTDHIIWFWKGFFLFSLLVSLVLTIITNVKMFKYYFAMNIGAALLFFGEIGEVSRIFLSTPYNITSNIKQTGVLLIFIFFPLLINEITPIAKLKPKLWKTMYIATSLVALSWFLCLFPFFLTNNVLLITTYIYNYYAPIFLLLQLYFVFVAYRNKQKNALLLFIGYSFYIITTFIYIILPNLGIIENDLYIYNTFIYGSIMEIVMFMVLIGKETLSIYNHRSLLLKKQKEHHSELLKAIVDSQEKERNKAGREIHDLIGANISVIKQQVDPDNKTLNGIIDKTIDLVRNLSHGLITPLIKGDEFVDEINELCNLFSNDSLTINSHFHNWLEIDDLEKATHIYRIIQELLQNAVKHSHASEVMLQFIVEDNKELTIMYEDDGIGFDLEKTHNGTGVGLINIENRIKLIDASIFYDTHANQQGTNIIINLKLK